MSCENIKIETPEMTNDDVSKTFRITDPVLTRMMRATGHLRATKRPGKDGGPSVCQQLNVYGQEFLHTVIKETELAVKNAPPTTEGAAAKRKTTSKVNAVDVVTILAKHGIVVDGDMKPARVPLYQPEQSFDTLVVKLQASGEQKQWLAKRVKYLSSQQLTELINNPALLSFEDGVSSIERMPSSAADVDGAVQVIGSSFADTPEIRKMLADRMWTMAELTPLKDVTTVEALKEQLSRLALRKNVMSLPLIQLQKEVDYYSAYRHNHFFAPIDTMTKAIKACVGEKWTGRAVSVLHYAFEMVILSVLDLCLKTYETKPQVTLLSGDIKMIIDVLKVKSQHSNKNDVVA